MDHGQLRVLSDTAWAMRSCNGVFETVLGEMQRDG